MNRSEYAHRSLVNLCPERARQTGAHCVLTRKGVLALIVSILAILPSLASAQIVSNLAEQGNGPTTVNSTSWGAGRFTTGSNAGGYTLESVTGIFTAQTTAGNFIAQIYSDSGSKPNVSLESLAGDNPATFAQHTFSSAGLSLDANTSYWVAWTATSGQYTAVHTFSSNEASTDGWTIGGRSSSSDSGGS